MKQRKKSTTTRLSGFTATLPNDPNRIVLQLDETLCVVNEISTPHTDTDCLSEENHELELDDVTKFLESDQDGTDQSRGRKSIPMLDRMKSFASGGFLQPRTGFAFVSDDKNENRFGDARTPSSLDNVSIDCKVIDELERDRLDAATVAAECPNDDDISGNIETPFDVFTPIAGKKDDSTTASSESKESKARAKAGAVAETESQYEFRNVNVTIQIKDLVGISRIVSRKKGIENNSEVKAIVSYQGRTIGGYENIFIDSMSLPLVFGDAGKKSSNAYAKWPSNKADTSEEESSEPSLITFSRSVMKPAKADHYVDEAQCKGYEIDQDGAKLPAVSDTFAPEVLTLQISLQRGSEEIAPIGVATIIIPWDYQDADVNVPVSQTVHGVAMKKKKLFAMRPSAFVSFENDLTTKYKLEERASLGIRLTVTPGKPISAEGLTANDVMSDTQINKDNKQWQKLGAASSKLTLYQRLQLFAALRKQQESQPENEEISAGKADHQSSKNSASNASDQLDEVQISVAENIPSTPTSRGLATHQSRSPLYSNKSQLSVITEAESVPLFELRLDSAEIEGEEQLSEISDSDSSCVTGSSGGTLTHSLYSAFSLNQRKGSEMTENVLKFLTCDPTLFFRASSGSEEEKVIESASSSDSSSSSSSGSTISTSLSKETDENEGVSTDLSFETPIHELPLQSGANKVHGGSDIAHIMSFDTPVQRLPK